MAPTRAPEGTASQARQGHAILDALPYAIFEVGRDDAIRYVNACAARLLGRERERLLGLPLLRHVEVGHRPAVENALERARAGFPVRCLECRLETAAHGSGPWVELDVTAAGDGLLLCARDVAGRHALRAAVALQHEALQETLASLLDTIPVGIVISDRDGAPRLVNRVARDLLGIQALTPLAGWCTTGLLLRPDGAPAEPCDLPALATLHDGRPRREVELQVVRPFGVPVPVLLNSDAVHDAEGRVVEVCCTLTDVRERRSIERQLQRAQKMEAVGSLAGGIAHDFNNILCAITGYSELALLQGGLDERGRELVEEIHKAGVRAARLTRRLLAFSRHDASAPRTVDLGDIVRDMEKMLRRIIGEAVDLEVQPTAEPCPVRVDPGHVEQILLNLVVNAGDALPEGGRLGVRTERTRALLPGRGGEEPAGHTEAVALVVQDDGVGMDEATLARIFEPFFTTKGDVQGTGLGLSTVHGLVKQNGGRVHVESRPGAGACFRVLLPLARESATPAGAPRAAEPAAASSGASILLVEDEDLVRSLVREILEQDGHRVVEARHGREALERLQVMEAPPDLVVTDVVMPEMGGRALGEALRGRRPQTAILFVSGYSDDAPALTALQDARTAFLPKPFDAASLLERVRALLPARRPA